MITEVWPDMEFGMSSSVSMYIHVATHTAGDATLYTVADKKNSAVFG